MRTILLVAIVGVLTNNIFSQGLEQIIVEKYYVNEGKEKKDKYLPEGAVTYRIYADMKPGYRLQVVFGNENHPLFFKTSTTFYNDTIWDIREATDIHKILINQNAISYDSWITMGAASSKHLGVLKEEDKDGSLLVGESMKDADGLVEGEIPSLVIYGLDLSGFGNEPYMSEFTTTNGAWALLNGIEGPTFENRVLIAQLTTDGVFSFQLCLQMLNPDCAEEGERYVPSDPVKKEIAFEGLRWSSDWF